MSRGAAPPEIGWGVDNWDLRLVRDSGAANPEVNEMMSVNNIWPPHHDQLRQQALGSRIVNVPKGVAGPKSEKPKNGYTSKGAGLDGRWTRVAQRFSCYNACVVTATAQFTCNL
jgi:hypothetical protein